MAKVESETLGHISMHFRIIAANDIICRDRSALNTLRTLQIKVESVVGNNITINNHSRWTILTFSNLHISVSTCEAGTVGFITRDIGEFWPKIWRCKQFLIYLFDNFSTYLKSRFMPVQAF